MKQRILKCLTLGVFAVALTSCLITDERVVGSDGDGRPTVLSFHPQMGGHGEATRGATYDEAWEEFKNFFGGDGHEDDIFFSPDTGLFPHGYGRQADRTIGTFRVMVFYGAGNRLGAQGDLVFWNGEYANHLFEWDDRNTTNDGFRFELPTGGYDFLFVANDGGVLGADGTTGQGGSGLPDEEQGNAIDLDAVKEVMFTFDRDGAGEQFDGQIHSELNIPMVTWIPGVDVDLGQISFTDLEGRYGAEGDKVVLGSEWPVWMRRAAIRLSFGFHMGAEQYAAWRAYHEPGEPVLHIDGVRERGWVFPHTDPSTALDGSMYDLEARQIPASTNTTTEIRPGKIIEHPSDGSAEVFFDRLIYPEYLPADPTSATGALGAYMRFDYGGKIDEKRMLIHRHFSSPSQADYSLPRNSWVWTRAEVLTDIDYTVRVVPWGDGSVDPTRIVQYNLVTDRSEILFRAEGHTERLTVFTDHPDDWTVDPADTQWGDGANGWFEVSPTTGPADATTMISIAAEENNTPGVRSGSFVIRAGNLQRTITVVQLPASGGIVDTNNGGKATMYVGAFWKAAQYGERLIRVERARVNPVDGFDGPWAAYVVEGSDWIVLDTNPSTDGAVGSTNPEANGNDDGFDAAHRVEGYRTSVSGRMGVGQDKGDIYFRVGLNGPYTPTAHAPARYGMILLQYTNGGTPAYQRLWVRQGEGDDYLMQPDQPLPAGAGPREKARRFSPYNLTIDEFINSNSSKEFVRLRLNGVWQTPTTFTHYPTQAGAHFRWAELTGTYPNWTPMVQAYNPVISQKYVLPGSIVSWIPEYESCPAGYRRPSDGPPVIFGLNDPLNGFPNIPVAETEMHQSLLALPVDGPRVGSTANSVWGYYADGFFDRRERGTQSGDSSGENNAVDTEKTTVAYVGRLFYNPERGNSLFFPAAGAHSATNSAPNPVMRGTGRWGTYWTTGRQHRNDASALEVRSDNAVRTFAANKQILSVRCVVDPGTAQLSVNPATIDGVGDTGGTRKVTVRSLDPRGVVVGWVVAGFDGDDPDNDFTPGEQPAWITVQPGGDGGRLEGQSIDLVVALNNGPQRTVGILFAQEGNPAVTATLTLTQAAAPPPIPPFSQVFTATTSNVVVEHAGLYYIEAWGGDGGAGAGNDSTGRPGAGGEAQPQRGLFRLTKNSTLNIQVGGVGSPGTNGGPNTPNSVLGGKGGASGPGGGGGAGPWFGKGGDGGPGGPGGDQALGNGMYGGGGGGGGGGASGVLLDGTDTANIILAAGGGGGGGGVGRDKDTGGGGGGANPNGGNANDKGGKGGGGVRTDSPVGENGTVASQSRKDGVRGCGGGGAGGGGWDGNGGGGGRYGNGGSPDGMSATSGGGGARGASWVGGETHVTTTTPHDAAIDARTNTGNNTTRSDSGRGGLVIISYLGSEESLR